MTRRYRRKPKRVAEDIRLMSSGVISGLLGRERSPSALGQLTLIAEFLEVTGLFARWMESRSMFYTSPNAPQQKLTSPASGCAQFSMGSDENLRRALAYLYSWLKNTRLKQMLRI